MKFYLMGLVIFFTSCKGQQLPMRTIKNSVVLYNNSNTKISILLGQPTKMDTFKLKEQDVWLSPDYNFNPLIKLQTQSNLKTYQLKLGNYYMIFWNDKKKYWDLKKTKKRE